MSPHQRLRGSFPSGRPRWRKWPKTRKVRILTPPPQDPYTKALQALNKVAQRAFDRFLEQQQEEIIADSQKLKRRRQMLREMERARGLVAELLRP